MEALLAFIDVTKAGAARGALGIEAWIGRELENLIDSEMHCTVGFATHTRRQSESRTKRALSGTQQTTDSRTIGP